MKPDTAPDALAAMIDQQAMLAQVQAWGAINTGTANLAGLEALSGTLAEAFSALPGEVEFVEPAPVTSVNVAGQEVEQAFGRHVVLRVRPEAGRRLLLTGHMDTVFPA
ncbi:MAG: hypothetical protein KJZ64_10095, partial [Sphingomonadaceae bacterium]|nr:hypothetical protein [Sphingomonadaceae bacterium]